MEGRRRSIWDSPSPLARWRWSSHHARALCSILMSGNSLLARSLSRIECIYSVWVDTTPRSRLSTWRKVNEFDPCTFPSFFFFLFFSCFFLSLRSWERIVPFSFLLFLPSFLRLFSRFSFPFFLAVLIVFVRCLCCFFFFYRASSNGYREEILLCPFLFFFFLSAQESVLYL